LFFTNRGKVYSLKCYEIPAGSSRTAKGLAVINLFPVAEDERVTSMVAVDEFVPDAFLILATSHGEIKKTASDRFSSVRSSGLIAMDLAKNDELVSTCLATDKDNVILVTQKGHSIKFSVSSLRASLRTSGGVRAIRLASNDKVLSMDIANPDAFLLVVTTNGFGKLTPISQYPKQHRAGSGVRTFKITDGMGVVAAARVVTPSQQVMIISAQGIIIRTPVKEKDPKKGITVQGRITQGVRLMRLNEGDSVVAITCFD
jgi:DNA gyrase subunit A